MHRYRNFAARALCAVSLSVAATSVLAAGAAPQGAEVTNADHATLPSLRGVMPRSDDLSHSTIKHAARPLPWLDGPGSPADGALQSQVSTAAAAALGLGFDGVGKGFVGPQGAFTVQYAPPDTNGAVGTTQYVQVVNTGFAIFDKATGTAVYGPVPTKTLFQALGGACAADNDGDAVVVFDKLAKRWVISQFAVTAAPYFQCVAVSKTDDATGGYNLYAFSYGSVFPDYPKLGVWPDAYYISFNMFNNNTFAGAKACAYDRAAMLAGTAATQQCFQLATAYGGLLPADVDGVTAPSAGSPGIFMAISSSSLNRWLMTVNWTSPASSTLSGPVALPVASYSAACGGGTCVPQQGVSQKLDSLADRLMSRLAYRNFGGYDSVVVTHSVQNGNYRRGDSTAVRWYEVRNPRNATAVYQQGTFSPDTTTFHWMGSIAQDKAGNMALGYSTSSSTKYPGIAFTGRVPTDALGTMQAETSVLVGTGSQSGQNLSRWGDYSSMSVDPVDDCTFWYTTEYLKATGAFNWSTRIVSFKFPSCS